MEYNPTMAQTLVTLDAWPHPLTSEGRETLQFAAAGRTVKSIIDEALAPIAESHRQASEVIRNAVTVMVDGSHIPVNCWDAARLQAGSTMTIRVAPRGGGDDSNPIQILATIAVIAASVAVPGLLGLTGLTAAFASAGIAVAGSLVVGALFPPAFPVTPEPREGEQAATIYSLASGANQARPYAPMICVLGRHRIYPDLAARPYTRVRRTAADQPAEQYLSQIYSAGIGDLTLSDIRIGATAISDYTGLSSQEVAPGSAVTLVDPVVSVSGRATLEWNETTNAAVPFTRTSPDDTTRIGIDLSGRAFRVTDEGETQAESVSVRITLVDDQGVHLNGVSPATYAVQGDGTSVVYDVWERTVPSGTWTVTVQRTTAPPSDTGGRQQAAVAVGGIRFHKTVTEDRSADRRYAILARASGSLSGAIARLNCIAQQKVQTWTGSAWTTNRSASSNPAAIFRAWCIGWRDGQGRLMGGSGRASNTLDHAALGRWYAWCETEGLTCNHVVSGGSAEEIEALIARCGRASPTWAAGKYATVWEDMNDDPSALITPARVLAGTMQVDWAAAEVSDEIVVRYIEPDADWQQRDVRRLASGVTTPATTATITIPGITSPTIAAEEANIQAARQKYQRRRIAWEMGRDGLLISRGDVLHVAHDLVQGGDAGRLAGGTAAAIEIDRDATIEAGDHILLELADGSLRQTEITAVSNRTLTLMTALPGAPSQGGLATDPGDGTGAGDVIWRIYSGSTPALRVRVSAVEPLAEDRVRLTAVDETAEFVNAISTNVTVPTHAANDRETDDERARDGLDGFIGADGVAREYIFARTASGSVPSSQRPSNSWTYDNPVIAGGLQWYDGAPGISSSLPYLWQCSREVFGNPTRGDIISADWSAPVIVGRYGPQGIAGRGTDGTDGEGKEDIFALVYARFGQPPDGAASLPSAQAPSNSWGFDSPGTRGNLQWHDGAPAITREVWACRREWTGTSKPTSSRTDRPTWRAPFRNSQFENDGNSGAWLGDGYAGSSVYHEYCWAVTAGNQPATNQRPANGWGFGTPGTAGNDQGLVRWYSSGAAALSNAEGWTILNAHRKIEGQPSVGDAVSDNWSPVRMIGAKGQDGTAAPILHIGLWSGHQQLGGFSARSFNFSGKSVAGYSHLLIAATDENAHTAAICRLPLPVIASSVSQPNVGAYGMQAGDRQFAVSRTASNVTTGMRAIAHRVDNNNVYVVGIWALRLA